MTAADHPAIELTGVSKRYWQLHEQAMLLKSLMPFRRPTRTELWALRGVDLSIQPGETIGIVGRNGAGKSTLLRLMAAVTRPTEGEVILRGRVAPLLSVGVGFHGEMSGRENVYVNGMLLGLTRDEIDERFDDVVAFASLGDFIDTPVKFYSSGMFLRLGFSVAIHVDPQILLVDEILAVGDIAFQLKCHERIRALQDDGTTIVLVSHSMHAIRLLCPRACVFRRGHLEFDGPVEEAVGKHYDLMSADEQRDLYVHERVGEGTVQIVGQRLLRADGTPTTVAHQDEPVQLVADLHFARDVDAPQVMFLVTAEDTTVVYGNQSTLGRDTRACVAGDVVGLRVPFQARFGGGGTYRIDVVVTDRDGATALGRSSESTIVYVAPRLGVMGVADLGARLLLDEQYIDEHEALTLGGGRSARPGESVHARTSAEE